jgi:HEAT repeat protein
MASTAPTTSARKAGGVTRRRRQLDPSKRLAQVRSLPADPSSRALLLEAVADPSLDVARAALDRLAELAGPAEIHVLATKMLELDIGIVGDVARTLRGFGDTRAAELGLTALEGESAFARQKAAVALGELRDPRARTPLTTALGATEAAVRRSAVAALAQLPPTAETTGALRPLLHDSDPLVRSAAVAAVAGLDTSAAATLRPAVLDPHVSVRRAAAASSSRLDRETVRILLGDPADDVRADTLWTLTATPRPELVEAVAAAALGDDSWHVRRAACHALAASRLASAKEPLLHALVDPHPTVRAAALGALESLLEDRFVEELAGALASPDERLRRALVEALFDRGEAAERALLLHAADPCVDVRLAVAHGLARSDRPQAGQLLAQLADDPDPAVRHAAAILRGAAADGA